MLNAGLPRQDLSGRISQAIGSSMYVAERLKKAYESLRHQAVLYKAGLQQEEQQDQIRLAQQEVYDALRDVERTQSYLLDASKLYIEMKNAKQL